MSETISRSLEKQPESANLGHHLAGFVLDALEIAVIGGKAEEEARNFNKQ